MILVLFVFFLVECLSSPFVRVTLQTKTAEKDRNDIHNNVQVIVIVGFA